MIFDVTGSYQIGFLISAAVSSIGIVLVLFLRPPTNKYGGNRASDSTQEVSENALSTV